MPKNITAHAAHSLFLDLTAYAGGVAVWGALPAVFDTTVSEYDRGVHVHARLGDSPKKVIDQTFQQVEAAWGQHRFVITEASSVAFTMSSIFEIDIIALRCQHCGEWLLDEGYDAVVPRRSHHCGVCRQVTWTEHECVANPLIHLKQLIGDAVVQRPSVQPDRKIALDSRHYRGGFQIWGSNPSIIWTANRLEESAIHVHAYAADGKRVIDNTYSEVYVGGALLDIEMIRVLQIQQALPVLTNCLTTVYCPYCQAAQFDRGWRAVVPHHDWVCEKCERVFSFSDKKYVSNPAVSLLKELEEVVYAGE